MAFIAKTMPSERPAKWTAMPTGTKMRRTLIQLEVKTFQMTLKKRVITGFFSGSGFSFSPPAGAAPFPSAVVSWLFWLWACRVAVDEDSPVEDRGTLAAREEVTMRERGSPPWAFALAQVRIRSIEGQSQSVRSFIGGQRWPLQEAWRRSWSNNGAAAVGGWQW